MSAKQQNHIKRIRILSKGSVGEKEKPWEKKRSRGNSVGGLTRRGRTWMWKTVYVEAGVGGNGASGMYLG